VSIAFLLAACLKPMAAHDLVATTITWDRDISRIVYSHCATCHRPSASAFSLLTYAEARVWAPAIKDSVLKRRMPPWGAVKGFGSFRNDEALTAEQLDLVAKWVDGGLPEGDARDLPRLPTLTQTRTNAAPAVALVVTGETKLNKPLLLDGLLPTIAPAHASLKVVAKVGGKIVAVLPDGTAAPLLWLRNYDPALPHPFLLHEPLLLPAGTVIRGVPSDVRIELLQK
jgi:mono/diheme cytochrome c family protein